MKMTKRVKKEPLPPIVTTEQGNNTMDDDDDQQEQQQASSPSTSATAKNSASSPLVSTTNNNTNNNSNTTSPPPASIHSAHQTIVDHTITLRDHMTRQLRKGDYECMICSNDIKIAQAIWSCTTCFRCYHIGCAKKWANSSASSPTTVNSSNNNNSNNNNNNNDDDSYFARQAAASALFRCPSCNTMNPAPQQYKCFCGKSVDPKVDPYITPHTCGEVCGKIRGNGCEHPCSLPCHCGPHPMCKFLAPTKTCPCGKSTYSHACGTPDPKKVCDNACGKLLNCGYHHCEAKCHHGPCEKCNIKVKIACHCAKVVKEVPCGSESFSCETVCGRTQRCGHCKCDFLCHAGSNCPPCATDPSVVTSCPCGKTPLPADIKRESCQDPIPTCDNRCGKVLPCGLHECEELCHEGPCPRCTVKRVATCPCGYNSKKIRCFEAKDMVCNKTCGATMSCGRHTCKAICCPDRRNPDAHSVAAHRCQEACGRQLMCGHTCNSMCHSGSCPPCPHWILEDLSCGCGSQYLPAPLPCGTKLPPCHEPCPRERPCGHNDRKHTCHLGECPPCSEVVERPCAGGHVGTMRVQCSTDPESISCGKICGKALPYCGHPCPRTCHGGSCTRNATKKFCQARCDQQLPCGHRCNAKCHVNHGAASEELALKKECPPCSTEVEVPCDCGIQTIKYSCKEFFQWKELNPNTRTAPCTIDCAFLKREAALRPAAAADPTSSFVSNPIIYSCKIWSAAKEHPDFFCNIEKQLAQLMSGKENKDGFKKLNPMNRERRGWVHELAWHYHIGTESVDVEPKRAVLATKTPASAAPSPLLSDAIYTGDDQGHNPFVLLRNVLSSRQKAQKSVLVFEGEKLTDVDLHLVLRPFMGKFVFVTGLDQLRSIPNLASDASSKFSRGDVNAVLAVFVSPVTCSAAFGHLRKTMCKFLFHMFGDDAPPRNVEDSLGRLRLVQQNACAFVTGVRDAEKDEDNLWEDRQQGGGSAYIDAMLPAMKSKKNKDKEDKKKKKSRSKNDSDDDNGDDEASTPGLPDTVTPITKPVVTSAWGTSAASSSNVPGSWANLLKK